MATRWVIPISVVLALGGCQWFSSKPPRASDPRLVSEKIQRTHQVADRRILDSQAKLIMPSGPSGVSMARPAEQTARISGSIKNPEPPKTPTVDYEKITREQQADQKSLSPEKLPPPIPKPPSN